MKKLSTMYETTKHNTPMTIEDVLAEAVSSAMSYPKLDKR